MQSKTNERNALIDIVRLICAMMVLIIHVRVFQEYSDTMDFFASFFIPRMAVPFFFCASGFFFIGKLLEDKANLKKNTYKTH